MQLRSCLVVALAAGSLASIAAAQQPRALPVQSVTPRQTADYMYVGKKKVHINPQSGGSDAPAVMYDSGGPTTYFYTPSTPLMGDHVMFNPGLGSGGPVTIESLDAFSLCGTGPNSSATGFPGGAVDYLIDIYDVYNTAASPINSGPIISLRIGLGTLPALGLGAGYIFGPVDLIAPAATFTVPDNDFVVVMQVIDANQSTPTRIPTLMPLFALGGVLTGSSENQFLYDASGNNAFEGNEWSYGFGSSPSNLNFKVTGEYTGVTGGCCLPAGCQDVNQTYCLAQGGTFNVASCATANCTPPPTGACCHEDGTCTSETAFNCTTLAGLYRGDNQSCGTAACHPFAYTESGDAGDLPGTAASVDGYGQHVTRIHGTLNGSSDGDMYKINICESATEAFSATSVGPAATQIDTIMALFDSTGHGLVYDDDTTGSTGSTISNAFLPAAGHNGTYYLAIAQWQHVPAHGGLLIWNPQNNGSAYLPEWAPNGPATVGGTVPNPVIDGWSGTNATTGNYTILLTGSCFQGCYANCDGSSIPPVLNANDFQCFLNAFAGSLLPGMSPGYANCDDSSTPPVLNANDFQCFLNAYAAGCP